MLAGLLFWLAVAASPAAAWKLYNDTTKEIDFEVYDEAYDLVEKGTLGPDGTTKNPEDVYTCGWDAKSCNPTKQRDSELTVIFRRDSSSWACSVTMLGGGYALVYQVENGNQPTIFWCLSQVYEGSDTAPLDVNSDGDSADYVNIDWSDQYLYSNWIKSGDAGFTAANRDIRFLVTGDPQINNSGVTDDCHYRNWCSPNNTGEQDAYDTFQEMTGLLRSDLYGYKRWNSEIRGIIVAGDLTQETRWDEFKLYAQMSTAGNVFTNNDLYPKKHPATDLIPLQERLFEGIGNHDLGVSNSNVVCQASLEARYGYQDCRKKIEEYVAEHNRTTKRTSWRTDTPHYSWEWHDVHFVQLNLFPGDTPSADHPDHDPQEALSFLIEDLAETVGSSKRPVVLVHHYGFDDFSQRDWFYCGDESDGDNTDGKGKRWWTDAERLAYWNAIADYNVVAIFTGHNHLTDFNSTTTSYGTTAGGESCVDRYRQGWRADFFQPDGAQARWDTATTIPAFVSAATRNGDGTGDGMYLDVRITPCNEMEIVRSDGDTDSITFYAPGDISLSCDPTADCVDVTAFANDRCQANVSIAGPAAFGICTQDPPAPYDLTTGLVNLDCENSDGTSTDRCSALVTVTDNAPPNLTCPDIGDTVLECGAPVPWRPTRIADNCDPDASLALDCQPFAGSKAALWMDGERGRCTISDTVGNLGRCRTSDRFQVVDTLDPVLQMNGAANVVAECKPGPYDDPLGSAIDQCDPTVALTRAPAVVGLGTPGTTTITYEARDSSGNVATAQRTLEVVDTIEPEVTLNGPLNDSIECGSGPYEDPLGVAQDQCSPTIQLTRTPGVVDTTNTGLKTLTYEARDASGNVGRAQRTLDVVDTLPPEVLLEGEAEMTVQCQLGGTWVDPGATADDLCWGPQTVDTLGGVPLQLVGRYHVRYRATDTLQKTGEAERWVTVEDTLDPVLSLLGEPSVTLECGVDAYEELGATAQDQCSGELQVSQSGDPVDTTRVGAYALDYTAVDGVGRSARATRSVSVVDALPPVPLCQDVVAEPTGPEGATVVFGAAATDACDPAPAVVCPDSGTTFAVGSDTVVTCTAEDAQGNLSSCSLTVSVLSETDVVTVLVEHVDALLSSGTVNRGQANSMQRKLDTIVGAIEDGRTSTACDQLAALQAQIQSWLDGGTLTPEEALPTQSSATNLQKTLGCLSP